MGSSLVFLNTMDTGVHGGCNAYTLFQVNINPSTCLISKVSTHNDLINRGLLSYVEAKPHGPCGSQLSKDDAGQWKATSAYASFREAGHLRRPLA